MIDQNNVIVKVRGAICASLRRRGVMVPGRRLPEDVQSKPKTRFKTASELGLNGLKILILISV